MYFQVLHQNLPVGSVAYLSKMSRTVSRNYFNLCQREWENPQTVRSEYPIF